MSFVLPNQPHELRLGSWQDDIVIDLACAKSWAQGARGIPAETIPDTLHELIHAGSHSFIEYAKHLLDALKGENVLSLKSAHRMRVGYKREEIILYPPLLRPTTIRDFYAFEQHVVTAHQIRGREIPPEWFEIPVFYYSNPNATLGTDTYVPMPSYTNELDFELEVACIIGQHGINLSPEQAAGHIFGYTIFNDWTARDIQRIEMKVGLGPAKAKDFATSIGPWVVTPDELVDCATDRPGVYDLSMTARINGKEVSRGNWRDMHYSFGEMISRASIDTYLVPGDIIASGTVGGGCLLEITKGLGPWLNPGDRVELEIERLGVLRNQIGPPQQAIP